MHCLSEAPASVRIEVVDTGFGISPDQLPFIFDEYYQADVRSGGSPDTGFGLGLSIARRLANLLRLELDVRSELGKGCTFSILLPAVRKRIGA